MSEAHVTMLSSMASADFEESLRKHRASNVKWLDLKDGIFGKALLDLDDAQVARAKALIAEHGLEVYCLSSGLFCDEVERGERHFETHHLARVTRLAELGEQFRPVWVRLLAATSSRRKSVGAIFEYLDREHPWLVRQYQHAVDTLSRDGQRVILENEVHGCIVASVNEVLELFRRIDRPERLMFTFDIGNLWQEGSYPTVESVRALAAITRYLHLKGGQRDETSPSNALRWASSLEDSSWPVRDVIDAYLAAGLASVICINLPHGERRPGYDYGDLAARDLAFVQRHLEARRS